MGLRIEIRPGEGGDEAEAFAQELAEMVRAVARRLNGDVLAGDSGRGRIVVLDAANAKPKFRSWVECLSGTHRVQRIPRNDRAGRRHTSTATVAVLNHGAAVAAEL